MEEIARTFEEYKEALNRVMKTTLEKDTATVVIGSESWLKKPVILLLWILFGMALLFFILGWFLNQISTSEEVYHFSTILMVEGVMFFGALLCAILIRRFTFKKTINLATATFEFRGRLRKNRTYTLAEYVGPETRRTIKDFPEEFRVRFKTANGTKSYKLADLNMGYASNIKPNHEAVAALWDAIIKQMQLKDNTQLEPNNNLEVAPDTNKGLNK